MILTIQYYMIITIPLKGRINLNEYLSVFYRISERWPQMEYHSHQEYEIYFFHSGSCRYLIHNQIYDLEPGDILLMDGMALHKANIPNNSKYVRSILHFSPQWIKGVLKEIGGMYLLNVFDTLHHCLIRTRENNESKELESVFLQLEEVSRSQYLGNKYAETEQKILLLQILVIVNRLGQLDLIKQPNSKVEKTYHAEKIATYIQEHYMSKLSLDSIAKSLSLSKSYVSHVFKEMTGFTVMEYVMGCRLTQVKYLLEMEPEKSLKVIAFECGFESVSHFSRYFKEKVGVTAKEFRQNRLKIYSEENR